ncbi:MAG: hypothetical protein JWN21_2551 [Sphingomonas bacterium]|uniref:class I SAM-dependent methyltransferase n=1 Tax=Sphingomonas bacterium TaxID=1895847 RepID=UPI002638F8D7|nr:class I SAM-dependent methyltransferase [Sphingomonas bacterium]MDB5697008.1 hypothetical protein [Sphingomonas bacterium]
MLEIGPFDNPAITGDGVSYFDVLDTAGLQERAARLGLAPASVPNIHYCSPVGDLSIVDRQFDAVVSSHAIEHQPDLIQHLNDVAAVLRPGGCYYVIAPDKRFCFDHFLPLSSSEDVVSAHEVRRRVHTRAAVLAHRLGTTHNDPLRHWLGRHRSNVVVSAAMQDEAEADAVRADRGEYVDVHAWIFSPQSFYEVVTELGRRRLIDLKLVTVHDTEYPQFEFNAVLQKQAGLRG